MIDNTRYRIGILAEHHREHLRLSALTDEAIDAAGFYTESDARRIGKMLNWPRPVKSLGPCLVIPYYGADGELNCFARLKPDRPRTVGGKLVKYEQPLGASSRAYIPAFARRALLTPRATIVFTEGEKKALAACMAGCPCIGLSGVWNWQEARDKDAEGRKHGERILIPDLAGIDWEGRTVPLAFDFDCDRNPNVHHAEAELARILTQHGARVVLIDLPAGPRDRNGIPGKMGVDDFVFAHGPAAFRQLIDAALADPPAARSLEDWRAEMLERRLRSLETGGRHLDHGAMGAGKSYCDAQPAKVAGKSLVVVPTHKNAEEVVQGFASQSLLAVAYPELSKKTCCNYENAIMAIAGGLAASSAVCPGCDHRDKCHYQERLADADAAAHRVATLQRAVFNFGGLIDGRKYISVHEDCLSVIRPVETANLGFGTVARVADGARLHMLDAYGSDTAYFLHRLSEVASTIDARLRDGTDTEPIDLGATMTPPVGIDAALFAEMKRSELLPPAESMRIVKAAASGELESLVLRVDRIFGKGGKTAVKRSVVGVWKRSLPKTVPIWLNDATAHTGELRAIIPDLIDATPGGTIGQQHPPIQCPALDVKKSSRPSRVCAVLRGILEAFPEYSRVGVIADKRHVPTILGTGRKGENLEPAYRQRIVRVEHFRSGTSRGSNGWLGDCDSLIVMGTPRVPPAAVRDRLIQTGNHQAAARDGKWERDYWSGIDAGGQRHTIRTSAYRDHDWHAAHQAIVRAELIQSMGRGRSILAHGIPVIVASNEPLELVVCQVQPLSDAEAKVLGAVRRLTLPKPKGAEDAELSLPKPKYTLLGIGSVSTSEVASAIGSNQQYARRVLVALEARGLVERIGARGGWRAGCNPTAPLPKAGPPVPPRPRPTPRPTAAGDLPDLPDLPELPGADSADWLEACEALFQ